MAQYDFRELSPADFERLVCDLLDAEEGGDWELFAAGRDTGIDIRKVLADQVHIVQCKHYLNTGVAGLKRAIRAEADKVRTLRPDRYIFATSLGLTPRNKDEIATIIGRNILCPSDVWGQADINARLARHSEVEKRHHKLWLPSTAVLERVVHSDVVTITDFTLDQIRRDIRRYVPTSSFPKALDMLDRERVVILVGAPGVGKTTLAKMLLYEHMARKFQPVVISQSIGEAFRVFKRHVPQVFYFDDFLGATFLGDRKGAFGYTEAKSIRTLIQLILDNSPARLILTTREHLLNQAVDESEQIAEASARNYRFAVRMNDYTKMQRAEVLYNHIHYGDLSREFTEELLRDDFYLQVIEHRKFNPRTVAWLADPNRIRGVDAAGYRSFVANLLDDSSEIWKMAYKNQVSNAGKSLLLTLFTTGNYTTLSTIERLFTRIHSVRANKYGFSWAPEDFTTACRELNEAFIHVSADNQVSLIDPSVHDLLNATVREAPKNALDLIQGASRFRQIEVVWRFVRSSRGASVLRALRSERAVIEECISCHVHPVIARGRSEAGSYSGTPPERMCACLVSIADRLRSVIIEELAHTLMDHLSSEPAVNDLDVLEATSIWESLREANWIPIDRRNALREQAETALLQRLQSGCNAEELLEVHELVKLEGTEGGRLEQSLLDGAEAYVYSVFPNELSACSSPEDGEHLLTSLHQLSDEIGIGVDGEMAKVLDLMYQWEAEERYTVEYESSEWGRPRKMKHSDHRDAVRQLFSSLSLDPEP